MNQEIKIIANPSINIVKGFHSNGIASGIKKSKKLDLGMVYCDVPATCFAAYTTNQVQGAHIHVCREHLADNTAQVLVVNSGVANTCTGDEGIVNSRKICEETAKQLDINTKNVLHLSTGVIGPQLPMDKIIPALTDLKCNVTESSPITFPIAIMTTDTKPKFLGVEINHDDQQYHIYGVTKGSGMIAPNMATLLVFIFTDANIEPALLEKAFRSTLEKSFNSITVDGDMSTNDTALIFDSRLATNTIIVDENGPEYVKFCEALDLLSTSMAMEVVMDGEGASKLIEIHVTNTASSEDARKIGLSIANSNLVKTAFYGEDANWGRIICAAGYSQVDLDPSKIELLIGDTPIFTNGSGIPFDEEIMKTYLHKDEIKVTVNCNCGKDEWTVWTSDLTNSYIDINAKYRT
jgi:glutamate N-acetyltransferase/amino-acid N-acetyltransferase